MAGMEEQRMSVIDDFWKQYKEENGQETAEKYGHYYFCNNEEDAKELLSLVISGKKKATASNYYVYESEGEPFPQIGDINILTDYHGNPQCIVKTTKVDIVPFNQVSAKFAFLEGEGDGTLEYWRRGHESFFTRECEGCGKQFSEEMLVVCEQFEVIYVKK